MLEAFAKRSLDDPDFFKAVQKGDLGKLDELGGQKTKLLQGGEWVKTNFINKTTGEFHSWFKGADELINQAYRQLTAKNGTKIQWYFENEITKNAVKTLFDKRAISGVELIFKPIN